MAAVIRESRMSEETKRCKKCGETLPLSEFQVNRRLKGGLFNQCKECERLKLQAWRAANPEKVREQNKRQYYKDVEHSRELARNWRNNNLEKARAKDRKLTPEQAAARKAKTDERARIRALASAAARDLVKSDKARNFVYWIYDGTCSTPDCSGYIGITNRMDDRLYEHVCLGRVPKNSELKILFSGTRQECLGIERHWRPRPGIGWNRSAGGNHGVLHGEEVRAKISASHKGKRKGPRGPLTEEHREKIGAALRGKKRASHSAERIEKNRLAQLGKHLSEETKEKIGAALRGRTRPAEIGVKIAAKLKGRKVNNDHLRGNTFNVGRKHSEETKKKLSVAKRGRPGRIWSASERAKLSATLRAKRTASSSQLEMSF